MKYREMSTLFNGKGIIKLFPLSTLFVSVKVKGGDKISALFDINIEYNIIYKGFVDKFRLNIINITIINVNNNGGEKGFF